MMRLVDEATLARARKLAAALRLAYVLTAAMPACCPRSVWRMNAARRCG
jgi:hypothetical protein